jgi:hypothetical protein
VTKHSNVMKLELKDESMSFHRRYMLLDPVHPSGISVFAGEKILQRKAAGFLKKTGDSGGFVGLCLIVL